ncbi:expressed unknown protein [Seminavis robusta]|uniref:Uncharacterized protein n=1 Tax=Seminavis robusta TaxID=568900 RepID=A0A9N8EBR5_9STRA|nr:expressed unknown protein [Seminavis robusta]|eukprot:Sro937_g222180.1 n/a (1932) ;mRNA; r:11328-17453
MWRWWRDKLWEYSNVPAKKCFLMNPNLSLQRQVKTSFGLLAIFGVVSVMIFAITTTIYAGRSVQEHAQKIMRDQVLINIRQSSHMAAKTLSEEFDHLRGTTSILAELVRDRIVGYPNDGWEDDLHVPFPVQQQDSNDNNNNNNTNNPNKSKPIPTQIATLTQRLEHHSKPKRYKPPRTSTGTGLLATTSSVFSFQGNCDPSVYSPADPAYYPRCTDANNNASTGGVVFPTTTAAGLEQKAADIGIFLKPLWESRSDMITVGVHLENSAAGATVHFPAFVHRNEPDAYESIGCDWMHTNDNPLTHKPFATPAQTAKCHPAGTMVPRREFNPMEQAWCRDMALNPEKTVFVGPMLDPLDPTGSMGLTSPDERVWSLLSGRAVFDRRTQEFIGCVSLATSLHQWSSFVSRKLTAHKISKAALVRVSDGTVVAAEAWDHQASSEPVHVVEAGVVPDMTTYHHVKHYLDKERRKQQQDDYYSHIHRHHGHDHDHVEHETNMTFVTAVHECHHDPGIIVAMSLIPETDFAIIQCIGEASFESIADIHDSIRDDVINLVVLIVVIGVAGLALALTVIAFVSMVLTKPLDWMQAVAREIVNHNDHDSLQLVEAGPSDEGVTIIEAAFFDVARFTPRSEITELVEEFQGVLGGFSCKGTASRVASKPIREIRNTVTWQSEFEQLYSLPAVAATTAAAAVPDRSEGASSSSMEGREIDVSSERGDDEEHHPTRVSATPTKVTDYVPFTLPYLALQMKKARSDESTASISTDSDEITVLPEFPDHSGTRKNRGRNLSNLPPSCTKELDNVKGNEVPAVRSKLFRWMVILIVVPLLITNLIIVTLVSWKVTSALSPFVEGAVNASFDIAVIDLEVEAKLAAAHTEAVLSSPVRDLFLWTRISSWLLFGAIERSDGFVKMVSGSEECKSYPNDGQTCPWYEDTVNNAPCDCEWQSSSSHECYHYDEIIPDHDTRRLQKLFFTAQMYDADPVTGSRVTTSFPAHSTSAETTAWYEDLSKVPGAWKQSSAEGIHTTYDRIRVSSAAAVVGFPLYNSLSALIDKQSHEHFGTFISFDTDGTSVGWSGCSTLSPRAAHFQSSSLVPAFEIDPTICPEGKYGFDARCWEWYQRGKEQSSSHHSLYISSPYHSPTMNSLVSTWTQSIVDPRTKEHIAQASMDWRLSHLHQIGSGNDDNHVAFLVSPHADAAGGDTVAGPNFTPGNQSAPIADVVLPDDMEDKEKQKTFNDLVEKMKKGESGGCSFSRSRRSLSDDDDDDDDDLFHIYYEPIRIRSVEPLGADSYQRGANASKFLVYSVGVARTARALREPSREMEEQANSRLENLVIAYSCCVVAVSLVVCLFAGQISLALCKPMLILLGVVRSINGGRIDEDIPPMEGGSREVNRVYSTFAKLFKIVRVSNSAFFSGNLRVAYSYVSDALRLYQKIGDDKASAIASNNLGNILLAMYADAKTEQLCGCAQTNSMCAVREATGLYNAAIESGVSDLENSDLKVEFSQQLANRYFNRGLFFLHSAGQWCAPANAVEQGRDDLRKASQLDKAMRQHLVERDLVLANACTLFDHWLRRLHGLASLWDIGERQHLRDEWDEAVLVNDCQQLLAAVWRDSRGHLFGDLDRIGRLQQLESAVIRLDLQRKNTLEAARLAMRMLAEDEFITEESFLYAAKALLECMEQQSLPSDSWSNLTRETVRRDLAAMVGACKHASLTSKKRCLVFCVQLADKSPATVTRVCDCLLGFLDSVLRSGDIVGCVAGTPQLTTENSSLAGSVVEGNGRRGRNQKSTLETSILALTEACQGKLQTPQELEAAIEPAAAALVEAIECIADTPESQKLETHIVYVTDKSKDLPTVERAVVDWKDQRDAPCHIHWLELTTEWDDAENMTPNVTRRVRDCTHVTTSLTRLVSALEQVSSSISLSVSLSNEGEILSGLTMEKF